MSFSPKQKEFYREAHHRWNVKSGATRSGKTFLDYYMIPQRIRANAGKPGLTVFLGNTKGTLQRNLIAPLQAIWGTTLVTDIRADNTAWAFGEKIYCLGADKVTSVNRVRGSSWKYLYGDEFATWHPEVFNMAKSRLDKSYSMADLTNNPESPTHWAYKFIHSDADLFLQEYCIDDNPFLDPRFVANLKREYAGTVYYDRYILGKWVRAEGCCYPSFHHNRNSTDPGNVLFIEPEGIRRVTFGIDFGGHKSATTMVCTGWFVKDRVQCLVTLDYKKLDHKDGRVGPNELCAAWEEFQRRCRDRWPADRAFADSAEPVLIKGLNQITGGMPVEKAMKRSIMERVRAGNLLYAQGRKFIMANCEPLIEAVENAVYDETALEDKRLDDFSSDIDSLDADEYSWERYITELLEVNHG